MTEYCDVGPECYSTRGYIARKPYKCCECRSPINAGERYLYCWGVWEDGPTTFRQHIACAEACEFFRDHINDGDCLPFGALLGEQREYFRLFDMKHKHSENIAIWRKMLADILWRRRH